MINLSRIFFTDIYDKCSILYELAKRDFQQQYMGSYLGVVWVYLQPLLFITVLYLVFTFGFKSGSSSDGVPFAVYLISGMIPWLYIARNLTKETNKQLIKSMNEIKTSKIYQFTHMLTKPFQGIKS